ncbi:DUF4124 domain-containing protein [Pseudomonas sp. RL_15y_Pfl2_60]|uniref:DUF4124 domain-containing protein n=1 Tax=Pseudomonas sp. RL_15y_Pfl2_60 TaxID=3088709 RepID=UPI0030DA868C
MRRMILATSLLLAISSTAMASQVYKWVDAQGVTHFGAQPPQGQQSTEINTAVPTPSGKPAVEEPAPSFNDIADPEQAEIDKKVKQEVAAKEAERKQYCTDVRTSLAQIENNPRVRVEIDGEVRRITEEERQQRIAETKKAISENCQ